MKKSLCLLFTVFCLLFASCPAAMAESADDSLYAEPPADPVQTAAAVPTEAPEAPDLSDWTGYWMTRDDSLAEMIITDNGDGTLHAKAMFLPAADSEATLTPQADGTLRYEDRYGYLTGPMIRLPGDRLRLDFTGGMTLEDEEATEYQGYYTKGFTFYPADYADMWYQTPEDAAASEGDWTGIWNMQGGTGDSSLAITREKGGLRVDVSMGSLRFSGMGELYGDAKMDLVTDDFGCMLLLNKKLNRIAMLEAYSTDEAVYDWTGNAYYGVVIYQREGDPVQAPDALPQEDLPSDGTVSLLPVPGRAGYMQIPVASVDATSWIEGKDPTAYAPFRMTDGEETTAFQFSTRTTKLGQAYLYFDFDAPVTIDELWIKNGFWKNADGKNHYTRNSRVKKMTIDVLYAGESGYTTLKTASLKDDKSRKDWKVIDLPEAQNVTGVRIRIDKIYKGSKYPTDVCISEIMFVQHAEQ